MRWGGGFAAEDGGGRKCGGGGEEARKAVRSNLVDWTAEIDAKGRTDAGIEHTYSKFYSDLLKTLVQNLS